jgi:hypothetical protein
MKSGVWGYRDRGIRVALLLYRYPAIPLYPFQL